VATPKPRLWTLSHLLLGASVVGIIAGGVLYLTGAHDAADIAWAATTVVGIVPLAWSTVVDLIHRETGVDLIALLAMVFALAFGEYLAGAVIALMLSSGQALEDFAERRAHKELSALLERAPRMAHRYSGAGSRPSASGRRRGCLLLVEGVVPVDRLLGSATCVLDESALTGESRPVDAVRASGSGGA
jgi:cation transport ATPase